jgi:uncharacterized circularly permuted ATP-grasp superfamily protein
MQTTDPLFAGYRPLGNCHDEIFGADGAPRLEVARAVRLLDGLGRQEFRVRMRLAEGAFLRQGVTFAVYADGRGVERVFPVDLIPRTVSAADWGYLERGLKQRVMALNAFLADVYGEQRILRDGAVPREMVEASRGYIPALCGVRPPAGVHVHIAGVDLVRGPDGRFVVLEDNVRTPSGVSYVLENRAVMKRVFPKVFQQSNVRTIVEYPLHLKEALRSVAPSRERRVVVLTPGPYNSAYFEHAFLAARMGLDLVQGADLFVHGDRVYVKTTRGPERVVVIYRRIDDGFLDPEMFNKDSTIGVPGLMRAYAAGTVALANAPGNGVADDKAIYPYVPAMIRFYLSEDPLLPQVETYICHRPGEMRYVLDNLSKLVVKAVDEAGGYGMLVGPKASKRAIAAMARRIRATPRRYIAQPLVELSTCPTWTPRGVAPRRVDLRPYVVTGASTWVLPGGLTRVALRPGSYVVNSSQGGGSKDTWVLAERREPAGT